MLIALFGVTRETMKAPSAEMYMDIKLIVEQASRGELVFPTNMRASLKLLQALDDPDCHLEAVAQLVLAEPLIAARLVAIANTVAYTRYGAKVDNVRTAVNLLGFKTLRSLVAAIIVRQFSSAIEEPAIRQMAEVLWQHCAHVAALANVIARHVTRLDPDTAMFAGIVHEIGGFYLLFRAEKFPELLEEGPDRRTADTDLTLAHSVLKALMVPMQVTSAVESLWGDGRNIPPVTLGDTLILANDLAPISSPLTRSTDASALRAAEPIDFEVRDKTLQAILAESADEIKSLTNALLI